MAIQMRRGLKADLDPTKLLPGEWAVAIDPETENQVVLMCFAAGVVKRLGTYEDFAVMIEEILSNSDGVLTDEQIAVAVEKYLEENPPTGTGGVSSWNDLEDRPFYEESGELIEIVPVSDLTLSYDVTWGVFEQGTIGLVADESYIVSYEGIEYKCVAIESDTAVAIGNLGKLNDDFDDTGEPFALMEAPSQGIWMLQAFDIDAPTDESDTKIIKFGIYGVTTTIKKLDAKYIPDEVKLPEVTTEDNNKILQVVDGVWTSVALADSSVATYIDDYINTALGGDY